MHADIGDSHRVANAAFIAVGRDVEGGDDVEEDVEEEEGDVKFDGEDACCGGNGKVVDSYRCGVGGDSVMGGRVFEYCA
uniref:Uncharacterized protein n=1 Tax=Panagrolaimus superbus TaxID=310955 RepID=A0A914YV54_9BILA